MVGGGKLPGASRIDRADWAVFEKKDGRMKALCKQHRRHDGRGAGGRLLGMCHSSNQPDVPNTRQ